VRNWYAKNSAVEQRMKLLVGTMPLYVSVITLGEIEFSHSNVSATDKAKQADFRKWMRNTFEVPRLEITDSTAPYYADIRRKLFDRYDVKNKYLENREDHLGNKCNVDENNVWIVSQALDRNLFLITNDKMNRIKDVLDDPKSIVIWPDVK
jgi:predicted nucleic acid-binding protein